MDDTKITTRHLLWLLNHDEMKQLYSSLGGKENFDEWSRGFIIEKIIKLTDPVNLFKNEFFTRSFINKTNETTIFIEKIIEQMEKTDLFRIYQEVASEKLKREDFTKSEVFNLILKNIPINDILRSKHLLARLKPKYVSITDIKSLKEEIEQLKIENNNISNILRMISSKVFSSDTNLQELIKKFQSSDEIFETSDTPDLAVFLKALYEESTSITQKFSPDIFRGIDKRLQEKLGISERAFILKGIELLLTHYLLSEVKELSWQPAFDKFIRVVIEELNKDRPSKERTDIPSLRNRVSKRLGITNEVFDELLIRAWKEDFIKLEAGAPIGELNVKYLVTKNGQMFYYVKIK